MGAETVIAVALAAGVLAWSVARHTRLPAIVVLLAFGAGLGPDGIGLVEPSALGSGLFLVVDFSVAVILFEGGLNLEWRRLVRLESPLRGLLTVGVLFTWIGATLAARALLGWEWFMAALFGSLVIVTGPTVVAPLARELRLRARIRTVLEAEGVLIDPIGAFVAVLVLQVVLSPSADTLSSALVDIAARIGGGAIVGLLAGYVLALALRSKRAVPAGLENVFTLGAVILLFEGANHVAAHAGLLAVPIAGTVVGNMETRVDRDLREFKDQLTVMLVGLLFVLLAADVSLAGIYALGRPGALTVAALVLVVRPLSVLAATANSDLTWRETLFVAWVAPRGIVAAAIASLAAVACADAGLVGGAEVRALVFLTIAVTVVLAGVTAGPLASLLGLRLGARNAVAIYGANGLGLALGGELAAADLPVLYLDEDPDACARAEASECKVVFGDPLLERTLARARFEGVGTVIGLTPNDHLNTLFVAQARDLFDVPDAYVALGGVAGTNSPEHVQRFEGRVLFEGPHDKQRWDVRSRIGELELVRLGYQAPADADEDAGSSDPASATPDPFRAGQESYVMLTCTRGKGKRAVTRPVTRDYRPHEGDVVTVALYTRETTEALAMLEADGWVAVEPPDDTE